MKKFIVAIVSILYLASTSGATISLHYCMGELVEANLSSDQKEKCNKCGMSKKKSTKGCCEDAHKLVKVEQGHEKGVFDMPAFVVGDLFITHTASFAFTAPSSVSIDNNPANGPPLLLSSTPLFIRYCNFRI